MYSDDLRTEVLPIERLYLDPNNPRFWSERSTRPIPDARIPEERVQIAALQKLQSFGIEELRYSILRNGFLPLDRIVVRTIEGHNDSYVVVEGNRRLAALQTLRQQIADGLIDEEHISDDYLEGLQGETDQIEVLIYEGGQKEDISWLLQGIRHISGILRWDPAQRARLVADQIETAGLTFTEAGQKFGLTARAVGRLYRSHKALQQMRDDDEFQMKARNDYFSLFEEAIRTRAVREWLDWNDTEFCFNNLANLRPFYAWISPDEEYQGRRRIHDPKHVKGLAFLLDGNYATLLNRVDQFEIELEEALGIARAGPSGYDWSQAMDRAVQIVSEIPSDVIQRDPADFLAKLNEIFTVLTRFQTMAEALIESDE